jgi:prolyl-tRNA editing enzyme YbaK/EbsC (Cys-tRNA(Pro) deacylase)
MPSAEGNLTWVDASDRPDLVAPPVADALPLVPRARVAEIDETLADTAAFCAAYDVALEASANCVVVEARRGERTTLAAVMILATDRADINGVVRRYLGARKISFADQAKAEALTGMQQGGITPVGLPDDWPILVDRGVAAAGDVVIGAGLRRAKLLLDGASLAELPNAEVLDLAIDAGEEPPGDRSRPLARPS